VLNIQAYDSKKRRKREEELADLHRVLEGKLQERIQQIENAIQINEQEQRDLLNQEIERVIELCAQCHNQE
jgi:LPS O-antigen subunit length determinant protein (WzzB/FepE family)